MTLFTGLSAFPLTPTNADGIVDTDALSLMVERLVQAGVDSIGLLGSTGIYAYLDRSERIRAMQAALEVAGGRTPVIVGVGALRTSWARELAVAAERAGAAGLLLAPMSYTPLTAQEARDHYRTVSAATGIPLCIYNNPGTTNFRFSDELIAELAAIPNISAIKMPLPGDGDFHSELRRLRTATPGDFRIGYSGDWGAAPSLLAGGDAWYSVIAGLLPEQSLALSRAAAAGDDERATLLDSAFAPLWNLFREHGSLRIMYSISEQLGLPVGELPLPLARVDEDVAKAVGHALEYLV
jgi:4-hydroxy-tetrahydrodipicolinate synthase